MDSKLFVSSSPHVHDGASSSRIMWTVSAALLPATIWSIYLFGLPAITVIVATIMFCAIFEALSQKVAKKPVAIADGSAVLTGLLLALTLPPGLPIWICAVGAFVAIVVTKAFFGGLGNNMFNPALTARVFLLIAFPAPLTKWLIPATGETFLSYPGVDAVTAATPLGLFTEQGMNSIAALENQDLVIGMINGSLGETSGLFLLLGGLFLMWRKIVTWHIPVSFLASVALFALLTNLMDGDTYAGPIFHLFTGGVIIGAFFMATDYVTSPMFPKGKIVFGIGCGLLTMIIRQWAGYPEGVSFAILLMNACVPIIDTYTRPVKYGFQRIVAEGGK